MLFATPILRAGFVAMLEGTSPALADAALLVAAAGAVGAAVAAWVGALELRRVRRSSAQLEALEEVSNAVRRLAADRGDLDLRRVEHVLIEIRDGQRRLEEALLRRVESPRSLALPDALPAPAAGVSGAAALAERVTNRLLAMGYERVQLVTPLVELEGLTAAAGGGDGEIVVEARRAGVPCKGRVRLRSGALCEVDVQAAYHLFP